MSRKKKEDRVVLKKQDTIGATDAEEDVAFLADCFVDTGDLAVLRNCSRPERIVLGRTGSGKTALLLRLLEDERAIEVKPENLALSYISNSNILQFFEALGVNLEPFYKLIWRHAFCVELLRTRFGLKDAHDGFTFVDRIRARLKGKQYAAALNYLETWGSKFWEETEHRVREITQKVEDSLSASVAGKLGPTELNLGAAAALSEEVRVEVVQRAQKIVQDAHVPQLNQILDLVGDVLDDDQKKYFIVIDRLDEGWVDDTLRYKLIMALLDTVKEFRRVRNAKIVIALRLDLLQRVYKKARNAGFQEEKLQSLYLRLRWTNKDLTSLVDKRINHLFRDRYSKNKALSVKDILVQSRRDANPVDYMLERTFLRPRDVICFFNDCIHVAEGRTKIAMKDVRIAEETYSKGRLKSVGDEWHAEFPNLLLFAKALLGAAKSQGDPFDFCPDAKLLDRLVSLQARQLPPDDLLAVCEAVLESTRPAEDMIRAGCSVFHRVGIIGVKQSRTDSFAWHADDGKRLDANEFEPGCLVQIHPMFWRALAIAPVK